MTRRRISDRAAARFLGGFNCAESILLTLTERYDVSNPLVPKIATPFGGGLARTASICGCVTGAIMGIGAKYGRMQSSEDREKAYSAALSFMSAFETRFGSLICYDLIGCDFRTPEGHKRFDELKESRCVNFVKGAIEIVLGTENQTVQGHRD